MRITKIKATNIDLTDAIRNFVEDKFSGVAKMVERFGQIDLDIEVGKSTQHHRKGEIFRCEAQAEFPGKKLIRAEKTEDDLYKAIIATRDVFAREVRKYRDQVDV